ncbi:ribokinase [Halomonas sp. HNIBRBA4712]|uniref:ribokinase n=1 Tax=Halomonas sp. HNIBRBA4712 TaxID=3373087 RepID=UPI003746CA47
MIFNYGSINIDHTYRVSHLVQPGETLTSDDYSVRLGGKGANQSLAVARANGLISHWGCISCHDSWIIETLKSEGVDTRGVALTQDPSGHTVIQVDEKGENAIVLYPGANACFDEARIVALLSMTRPGDMLLIQNECSGLERIIPMAVSHGCRVAFNPAPMGANVKELALDQCELLFFNRVEAASLLGMPIESSARDLLRRLHHVLGQVDVVLTLGGEGAWYQCATETHFQAALKVEVKDTTAAGDTFIGYFLAARQAGALPRQCLRKATAAAALTVQRYGSSASIPAHEEVEELLQQIGAF